MGMAKYAGIEKESLGGLLGEAEDTRPSRKARAVQSARLRRETHRDASKTGGGSLAGGGCRPLLGWRVMAGPVLAGAGLRGWDGPARNFGQPDPCWMDLRFAPTFTGRRFARTTWP